MNFIGINSNSLIENFNTNSFKSFDNVNELRKACFKILNFGIFNQIHIGVIETYGPVESWNISNINNLQNLFYDTQIENIKQNYPNIYQDLPNISFSNIPEYANPIEHEDFAIVNYKDAYSPKGGQFSKVTQTGLYDGFYTARQFEVHKREQAKNYMRQRQTFTLVDDPNGEPSNGAGPQHDNTTDPGGGFGNGSWT